MKNLIEDGTVITQYMMLLLFTTKFITLYGQGYLSVKSTKVQKKGGAHRKQFKNE